MKSLFFGLLVAVIPTTVFSAESVYTKLNLEENCVFHSEYEQGASAYCSGYKGYPVHFSEGDLRQMVRFGHITELDGQWESFGQFNRVGTTIEWRLENGKPYATILRWFIENSNENGEIDESLTGQILVVSRVADHDNPVSCVIGYVDARANSNANEMARQIADSKALKFQCAKDKAVFHGDKGKFARDPVSWFE